MIHFELCNGLDLRICETCKRNATHYAPAVVATQPARIVPAADPPRCVDWSALPRRTADSSHGRL